MTDGCDYDIDCLDEVVHYIRGMRYCRKHGPGGGHLWMHDLIYLPNRTPATVVTPQT